MIIWIESLSQFIEDGSSRDDLSEGHFRVLEIQQHKTLFSSWNRMKTRKILDV